MSRMLTIRNNKYWYSNGDIKILLHHYFKNQNVFVSHEFTFEQYERGGFCRDYTQVQVIERACMALVGEGPDFEEKNIKASVIPLHIGSNHWLICMFQLFKSGVDTYLVVRVCDSIEGREVQRKRTVLEDAIKQTGKFNPNLLCFIEAEGYKQTDGYNCGPLTVENARLLYSVELDDESFTSQKQRLIKTSSLGFWNQYGTVTEKFANKIREEHRAIVLASTEYAEPGKFITQSEMLEIDEKKKAERDSPVLDTRTLEVPSKNASYTKWHIMFLLNHYFKDENVFISPHFTFERYDGGDYEHKKAELLLIKKACLVLTGGNNDFPGVIFQASVVPLFIGYNHWLISMFQLFKINETVHLIIRLCDSIEDNPTEFSYKKRVLRSAIKDNFGEAYALQLRIIQSSGLKQVGLNNCGPLTVENARLLHSVKLDDSFESQSQKLITDEVKDSWSEDGTVKTVFMSKVRKEHREILSPIIDRIVKAEESKTAPLSPIRQVFLGEEWKDVSPPYFSPKNAASAIIQGSIAMTRNMRRRTFIFICVAFFFVIGIIILIVELTRKHESEQKYTPPLLSSPAALYVSGNSQFAPSTLSNRDGKLLFCPSSLSDGARNIALNCFTVGGATGVFDISVVVKNYSQASKVVLTDFAAIDYCVVSVNGARQVSFPTDDFDDISVGETVGAPLFLVRQSSQTGVGKAPPQDYSNTTVGFALGGFDPSRDNTVTFRLGVIGAGQIYFIITAK